MFYPQTLFEVIIDWCIFLFLCVFNCIMDLIGEFSKENKNKFFYEVEFVYQVK